MPVRYATRDNKKPGAKRSVVGAVHLSEQNNNGRRPTSNLPRHIAGHARRRSGGDIAAPKEKEMSMFRTARKALFASVFSVAIATPAAAIPMSDTLFGEVTEILDPALALDYVVGTPASLSATWDTDDLFSLAFLGLPDHAAVSLSENPGDSSLAITLGGHSWTETDDVDFGVAPLNLGGAALPLLIFTAQGRLLGADFVGRNANDDVFAILTEFNILDGFPIGEFVAGTAGLPPGVLGEFRVAVPEPATIGLFLIAIGGFAALRRRQTRAGA